MKKFKFNLESVLNFRQLQEEQAKQRFGQAKMYALRQKELLQHYQEVLSKEQETFIDKIDISLLQHKEMYIDCLCQRIERQEEAVKKAEDIVRERQIEVTKAVQATKVLDNLKEKRYQEYLAESNHEEQKLLDEIGLIRFVRQAVSNE